MSEYDDLIEGYEPSVLASEDLGPLTDEEFQRAVEMMEVVGPGEPLLPPSPPSELRVLKGDELPQVGVHYVIYEGVPRAVTRALPISEDVYVSGQMGNQSDPARAARADRYARTRLRGYLCGEISTL